MFSLQRILISVVLVFMCWTAASSQDVVSGSSGTLDDLLKTGFNLLAQKKFGDARIRFEGALATLAKKPQPSEWLFEKIQLSDENPGDAESPDAQVRQITGWRHGMGTQQAVFMFLAFTSQLEGNGPLAGKYYDAIYKMQGPLWGSSWQMFVPLIEGLYYTSVPAESSENYARFEFMAGKLLYSAGEKKAALAMMRKGYELIPKDADMAGSLAGYYLIAFEPAEARKYGEISVGIDPKQGRVYIDLGTACWLLNDIDATVKYASMAQKLEPGLPGPHSTLALAAFEKGDAVTAAKEASQGVQMSKRFPYYLTVQAIIFESAGKGSEAEKLMKEAWKDELPDAERLKKWFFRDKSLELALKIVSRLK